MIYIVRNRANPALVLTTLRPDGSGNQWKPARQVGPGGYSARTFRTEEAAARHGIPEAV
jgi:hypothetical protein